MRFKLNLNNPDLIALNPGLADLLGKTVIYPVSDERVLNDRASDKPLYRSRAEYDYAAELTARGIRFYYEALHIALGEGGILYTPDFHFVDEDGQITVVEIKGSSKMKGARDSLTRFKVAAARYPQFRWLWIEGGSTKYHYGA